jgi:hypothetical protein
LRKAKLYEVKDGYFPCASWRGELKFQRIRQRNYF